MFEFLVTDDFKKSLDELDKSVQERVKEKLNFLSQQENPLIFAKKLKGHKNIFRFRAGDFRIIFQISNKKIVLLFIKHRKEVYKGL